MPHEDITRVVIRLWAIWHARRKAIHENQFQSPLSTNCFVERYISELDIIKPPPKEKKPTQPTRPRWIPPPGGFTKINVDASISKNSGICAAAAVARDGEGKFLGASTLVMEGALDVETVEAIACREGLALAADLLLQRIRLATDCAGAVRNIQGEGMGNYGHIVQEIKARRGSFTIVEFVHEHRDSNVDAHVLARSRHVWYLTPPEGVRNSFPPVD
ncbi:hypothetical protein EJB05_31656, partial [Eragrostis curvula]